MALSIKRAPQRKERALEVSFHEEIKALRMGAGEVFHGEGILAIT
jgi:indolepyruvate ferredoxin oxidoreductase alpha subunit